MMENVLTGEELELFLRAMIECPVTYFANRIGVTPQTLYNYIKGRGTISKPIQISMMTVCKHLLNLYKSVNTDIYGFRKSDQIMEKIENFRC